MEVDLCRGLEIFFFNTKHAEITRGYKKVFKISQSILRLFLGNILYFLSVVVAESLVV